MKKIADLSMMTHVPIQAHWFAQLPAFQSADARIVRGCLNMLMGAFHGQPAGTLMNTPECIATVAQLPLDVVIENMSVLTKGWKTNKDGLTFLPMAEMAARLSHNYGDAIQRLQDGAVIAIAAPDLFNSELLPTQGDELAGQVGQATLTLAEQAMKDTKVKRRLPEGAGLTPDLQRFLLEKGFSLDMHEDIWARFFDYQTSNGTTSLSWSSAFRHWAKNQIQFNRMVPNAQGPSHVMAAPQRVGFSRRPPTPVGAFPAQVQTSTGERNEQQALERLGVAQRSVLAMRQGRAGGMA